MLLRYQMGVGGKKMWTWMKMFSDSAGIMMVNSLRAWVTLQEIGSGLQWSTHVRVLLQQKYRCWSELVNTPDDDLRVIWLWGWSLSTLALLPPDLCCDSPLPPPLQPSPVSSASTPPPLHPSTSGLLLPSYRSEWFDMSAEFPHPSPRGRGPVNQNLRIRAGTS